MSEREDMTDSTTPAASPANGGLTAGEEPCESMVERVARGMWGAAHWLPDMPSFAPEYEWDEDWPSGHGGFRELFRALARAAIQAMREPDEAMILAIDDCVVSTDRVEASQQKGVALLAYTEMIDAALQN